MHHTMHHSEHTEASLDKLEAQSLQELSHQLPLAQNVLEAIEEELEELMAIRDAYIIRVAAMSAKLTALQKLEYEESPRAFAG